MTFQIPRLPIAPTLAILALGCGAPAGPDDLGGDAPATEDVAEAGEALSTGIQYLYDPNRVYIDESVPGVRIAVTVCKTTTARRTQVVECPAHYGFALVAGGFRTLPQNGQVTPLVTESYPANSYFWHVRSQDHKGGQSTHHLEVYTIGILLEGVTVDHLRKVYLSNYSRDVNALSQTVTFPNDVLFSGGFFMNAGTFGAVSRGNGTNGWTVTGREAFAQYADFTRLHARLGKKGIIQDFGALEVRQRQSTAFAAGPGTSSVGTALGSNTGWGIVGWGADSQTSSGAGRMLSIIGSPAAQVPSARSNTVASVDAWGTSTGTLAEYHTEVRKVPGSHGLCTTGGALAASMDSCVASICARDPYCCNTGWDSTCVTEVTSVCGKSCEEFTCSVPAFSSSYWSSGDPKKANCYAYATNTTKGYMPGLSHWWAPAFTKADLTRALIGDGLLPSSRAAACPGNRMKIALAIRRDGGDYHFYRRDFGTDRWSHKFSSGPPKQVDDNGTPITDPELAVVGSGQGQYLFQAYFCACSGYAQGSGKHRLEPPTGEEYPYPTAFELPP